jgi:hypothetical protein
MNTERQAEVWQGRTEKLDWLQSGEELMVIHVRYERPGVRKRVDFLNQHQ